MPSLTQQIAACNAALEDLGALKARVGELRGEGSERAAFAASLFDLERARLGDADARANMLEVADSLLGFWREGRGEELVAGDRALGTLWKKASGLLESFAKKRFEKALEACWEARRDPVLLRLAVQDLVPEGERRVDFAACLFHLELVRMFVDSSRAEFARRIHVLQEAYLDAAVAAALIAGNAGLQTLFDDVVPYLDEFFEEKERAEKKKKKAERGDPQTEPEDRAVPAIPPVKAPPLDALAQAEARAAAQNQRSAQALDASLAQAAAHNLEAREQAAREELEDVRETGALEAAADVTDAAQTVDSDASADFDDAAAQRGSTDARAGFDDVAARRGSSDARARFDDAAAQRSSTDARAEAEVTERAAALEQAAADGVATAKVRSPLAFDVEGDDDGLPTTKVRADVAAEDEDPERIRDTLEPEQSLPPARDTLEAEQTLLRAARMGDTLDAEQSLPRAARMGDTLDSEQSLLPAEQLRETLEADQRLPPARIRDTLEPGQSLPPAERSPAIRELEARMARAAAQRAAELSDDPERGRPTREVPRDDTARDLDATLPPKRARDVDATLIKPRAAALPVPPVAAPSGGWAEGIPEDFVLGGAEVEELPEPAPTPVLAGLSAQRQGLNRVPPPPLDFTPPPKGNRGAGPPPPPDFTPPPRAPQPPAFAPDDEADLEELAPEPASQPRAPAARRENLDITLDGYVPPTAGAQAFWAKASTALGLLPPLDAPRVGMRTLAADSRGERRKLNDFLDELGTAVDREPDARALACLLKLYLAAQVKEKSLFGGANPRRKEAFDEAFALLSGDARAAGHGAVWFELDGPETVAHLQRGLSELQDFLVFCLHEQLDPLDAKARSRFFAS